LYTNRGAPHPEVISHLDKFKEILLNRPENNNLFVARPRNPKLIENEKIVVSRWGAKTRKFAYQSKDFYELSDINVFILKKDLPENIFYILGLLNSALISQWFEQTIGKEGAIQISLLKKIPIYRIDFNNPEEVKMHDKIVENVKFIRENMAKLARYSKFFKERLTKLDLDAPLPEVNNEEIIKSLPPEKIYSLRTHPDIKIIKPKEFNENSFYISRIIMSNQPTLTGTFSLELKGKNKKSVFIEGASDLLDLIADVLTNKKGKSWKEIKETLIPESMTIFNKHKTKIINNVQNIRNTISQLQNEINQIVYCLYGLNKSEIRIIEGKE